MGKFGLLLVVALFFCAFVQVAVAEKKLIFVQELFRHGARYPIYVNSEDGSSYAAQEHSVGELTTQGKNMHYQLGKKIYSTYWRDLFGGTPFEDRYNQSKFYIKSTDVNRTIESCQSHLMGIFENLPKLEISEAETKYSKPLWPNVEAFAGPVFPDAQRYHPLPIHVEKIGADFLDNGDFLRSYSPQLCPNQDVWTKQNGRNKDLDPIFKHKDIVSAINALSKALNKTVTFQDVGRYYDNYETTLYLGRPTLPIFDQEPYARTYAYIYTMDLYINLFYTEMQRRTTSSGFFNQTIFNIKRAIRSKDVQWVIYSAHDTTVGNMLAAMNMTNVECIFAAFTSKNDNLNSDTCVAAYPGYTASIIFEVYEDTVTKRNTFKIRYMGVYRKIPFCGYQEECDVDRLYEWYDTSIKVDSFASNCGLYNEDKNFYLSLAFVELGIILCLGVAWATSMLKKPRAGGGKKVIVVDNPIRETMLTEE